MSLIRLGWAAVAVALAAARLAGIVDPTFQAIAHLVVGGFFGAWAVAPRPNRYYAGLGVAVSLVELYAFLAGIGH